MNTTNTTSTNQYCIKCHKFWGSEARKWYCSVCFKEEEKNIIPTEKPIETKDEIPKETEKMDIDTETKIEKLVQVHQFI